VRDKSTSVSLYGIVEFGHIQNAVAENNEDTFRYSAGRACSID